MGRLPDMDEGDRKSAKEKFNGSRSAAFFTIIKCNWGIGMMAMPYMLDSAGTVSGIAMFISSMLLTQITIINVLEVKKVLSRIPATVLASSGFDASVLRHSTPVSNEQQAKETLGLLVGDSLNPSVTIDPRRPDLDYSTIMAKSLGPFGDWGALFAITTSSYGSCVAYMLFIVQNMIKFFPDALSGIELKSAEDASIGWIVLLCLVMCSFAWLDSVNRLAPFSLFGLMCAFAFASVTVYNTVHLMSPQNFTDTFEAEPMFKPATFILSMSIAVFCNEGIVVLSPSAQSSMDQPELYAWTAWWGLIFFIVCYMAVGISGQILYSGDVRGQLSLNFDEVDNPVYQVAVILYSLQLIPTFAVVFFVASEALETKWLRHHRIADRQKHFKTTSTKLKYYANRCMWIVISGIIALQIPHFGAYLGLIGALGTSLGIYIMPQLAYLRVVPRVPGHGETLYRLLCVGLTIFGIFLVIAGTYVSAATLLAPPSSSNGSLVV